MTCTMPAEMSIACQVCLVAGMAGDEILMVGFDRVAVPGDGMSLTCADGDRVVYPGIHYFDVANGVGLNATFSVTWKDEAMTLPR